MWWISEGKYTWMYLWICHEACLPSFTDSTEVFAKPAMSPPANTQGSLVCIVSVLTSGVPQRVSFTGAMASVTMDRIRIRLWKKCHHHINVPRINVDQVLDKILNLIPPPPQNLAIGLWGIVSMVKHFKEFVELIGTVMLVHINHTKISKHTEK